jgi:hypothetical protein
MRRARFVSVTLLLVGCSRPPTPAPTPAALVPTAILTPAPPGKLTSLIEKVTGQKPTVWVSEPQGQVKPVQGLMVQLPQERFPTAVRDLQAELPAGQYALRAELRFGLKGQPDDLVVVPARDQWEVLDLRETDGVNLNLSHQDVVKQLRAWDKELGLKLIGAGLDWAEFDMERLPSDLPGFCQKLYKFCPDIVDQGVGDVSKLEQELRQTKRLYLWWD